MQARQPDAATHHRTATRRGRASFAPSFFFPCGRPHPLDRAPIELGGCQPGPHPPAPSPVGAGEGEKAHRSVPRRGGFGNPPTRPVRVAPVLTRNRMNGPKGNAIRALSPTPPHDNGPARVRIIDWHRLLGRRAPAVTPANHRIRRIRGPRAGLPSSPRDHPSACPGPGDPDDRHDRPAHHPGPRRGVRLRRLGGLSHLYTGLTRQVPGTLTTSWRWRSHHRQRGRSDLHGTLREDAGSATGRDHAQTFADPSPPAVAARRRPGYRAVRRVGRRRW